MSNAFAHMLDCIHVARDPGQPEPLFAAVDGALQALIGHSILTIEILAPEGDRLHRIYTTAPEVYPLDGDRELENSILEFVVIDNHAPYIGRSQRDIEQVFPEYSELWLRNVGSAMVLPIVWNGGVLGMLVMQNDPGWYNQRHVALAEPFAHLLIPALLSDQLPTG